MRWTHILVIAASVLLALAAGASAASATTVSGDSLASVPATGWTIPYTVYGTGFLYSAQVWVGSPAGVPYQVIERAWTPGSISGTLTIPATAAPGTYTVFVQNPGQTAVSMAGVFYKLPTIAGDSLVTVSSTGYFGLYAVYGPGFVYGAQAWIRSANGVTYPLAESGWSWTRIAGLLSLPASAPPGLYSVHVQNRGQVSSWKAGVFSKTASPVRVVRVSPNTDMYGRISGIFVIDGNGFTTGSQVSFVREDGRQVLTAPAQAVSAAGTRLQCSVAPTMFKGIRAGGTYYHVTVANGGVSIPLVNGFRHWEVW